MNSSCIIDVKSHVGGTSTFYLKDVGSNPGRELNFPILKI